MNLKFFTPLVLVVLLHQSQARTWTDSKGRTIEADMVSADSSSVMVMMATGRQFKLPLAGLSQQDKDYVKEWLEAKSAEREENGDDFEPINKDKDDSDRGNSGGGHQAKPKPKAGEMTFDGQPMKTGGFVNKYEYTYNEEDLKTVKKWKSDDTGYKIAIAVPSDFDPAGPMKVFIPSTAVNNEAQGRSGNFGVVGFYAKKCVENGWVCIAEDTNLGRKNHNLDFVRMMDKLNAQWPGFRKAEFAVGGFSGGGKACWWDAAYLIREDYKVIGAMLSGVNADLSMDARSDRKAPKGPYKDIKVHLSNGKWDDLADGSKQDYMEKSLRKNGMRKIKKTFHDGKHNLEVNQIPIALEFFTSDAQE